MKNKIFIDVDGVLVDFSRPFLDWCFQNGYTHSRYEGQWFDWDFSPLFINPANVGKAVGEFQRSGYWVRLPMLTWPGPLLALKRRGAELHILSSVTNPLNREVRTEMLKMYYGADTFDSFNYVTSSESKLHKIESLCSWDEVVCLVDDKPSTIEEFCITNRPIAVVSHCYNDEMSYDYGRNIIGDWQDPNELFWVLGGYHLGR